MHQEAAQHHEQGAVPITQQPQHVSPDPAAAAQLVSDQQHPQSAAPATGQLPADQQQPQNAAVQPNKQRKQKQLRVPRAEGCLGALLQIINSPWLLVLPALFAVVVWSREIVEFIAHNLDKPYLLAAGPATVVSVVVGWLSIKFFATIAAWCKMAWNAFQRGRKEDANGLFFWLTIIVFMAVSVTEAGPFFDTIMHHAVPFLGYAMALVIDLIAVNLMRARLEAVRMHDKKGALLYLVGVAACAALSAFANLYTALSGFTQPVSGDLPSWMNSLAPWLAMAFPAMILLMSLTADYSLDRTSTKLDADRYREQEKKRVNVLQVRLDTEKERLNIEKELARLAKERKTIQGHRNDREFILVRLFFPRKPSNTQDAVSQIRGEFQQQLQDLSTRIRGEFGHINQMISKNAGQIQGILKQVQQMDLEVNLLVDAWNSHRNTEEMEARIVATLSRELRVNLEANAESLKHEIHSQLHTIMRTQAETQQAQMDEMALQFEPKFEPSSSHYWMMALAIPPSGGHNRVLAGIREHPEFQEKLLALVSTNPRQAISALEDFLREQGLEQPSLHSPTFLGEVITLLLRQKELDSLGGSEQKEAVSRPTASGEKVGNRMEPASKAGSRTAQTTVSSSIAGTTASSKRKSAQGNGHEQSQSKTKQQTFSTPALPGRGSLADHLPAATPTPSLKENMKGEQQSKNHQVPATERETDPKIAAAVPVVPNTPAPVFTVLEEVNIEGETEKNVDIIASEFVSKTDEIMPVSQASGATTQSKITQKLAETLVVDQEENRSGFSQGISSELERNVSSIQNEFTMNVKGKPDTISEDFVVEKPMNLQTFSQKLPSFMDDEQSQFEDNFNEDGDNSEGEFEGNKRRGRYYVTVQELADQHNCSIRHIKVAIDKGMVKVSDRTNRETDPVETWKIKTSSIPQDFTPPKLPGRPPAEKQLVGSH